MIILKSATGFSQHEIQLLVEAVDHVNQIWATQVFADAVAANGPFTMTGQTPAQVLSVLRAATLNIDFFIFWPSWWKRHFSREIAYEDSQGIHFDKNKFDAETFAEICNTVAHEAAHAAGYAHAYGARSPDPSVPVRIGDITESLAK